MAKELVVYGRQEGKVGQVIMEGLMCTVVPTLPHAFTSLPAERVNYYYYFL